MSNEDIYKRIYDNPKFQELVAKRGRFAWSLAALMLGVYVIFILLIAFQPQILGIPLGANTVTTVGIPVGVGIIILAFALTGVYVKRANGEFDRITKEILKEVQK